MFSPPPVHTVHHDCTPRHQKDSIVKYEDDTTPSNREEIKYLAESFSENNLLLNVKTKELIVDFRKMEAKTHTPVHIRFLRINISEEPIMVITLKKKADKGSASLGNLQWLNLCAKDFLHRKALQQLIKPREHHWYHLQSISDISEVRCLHRAQRY